HSSYSPRHPRHPPSFPTRRSSDLPGLPPACRQRERGSDRGALLAVWGSGAPPQARRLREWGATTCRSGAEPIRDVRVSIARRARSEEHTSELQSLAYLVCRLLLEK